MHIYQTHIISVHSKGLVEKNHQIIIKIKTHLLVENGLGLTSITGLFPVITSLT